MTRFIRRSRNVTVIAALFALAVSGPALADPWIPAAGHGTVQPMVRLFQSSGAYSAAGFTTSTIPASTQQETQLRVTGVAGIGDGFSIEYDLRAGRVRTARTRHVRIGRVKRYQQIAKSASGLEDQEVGLNYGLVQTKPFADSVTFNLVFPTGSTSSVPQLGSGHFAVEPDFQAGIARGRFSATMLAGARIFFDSGTTEVRGSFYADMRVLPRISLFGTAFVSRTVQQAKSLPLTDLGEVYNIVRVGGGVEYRLTRILRPFAEYEVTVAGQGIHAGRRIVFGVALKY